MPPPDLPSGLTLHPDYMTPDGEAELVQWVDLMPWDTSTWRRKQSYGYRYDYQATEVHPESDWLGTMSWGRQVSVDEFQPGTGVNQKIEAACWGPVIAILSLLSDVQMDLTHTPDDPYAKVSRKLLLPRRSLLLLEGEARYEWTHGIAKRKNDPHFGIRRARRLALTFRLFSTNQGDLK